MNEIVTNIVAIILMYVAQLIISIPLHFAIKNILDSKRLAYLVTIGLVIAYTVAFSLLINISIILYIRDMLLQA